MAEGGPRRKSAARASSLKLEVDVVRHAEVWRGAIGDAIVKRAARAAFLTAPPPAQGSYEITILLTNDAEMRDLNRAWRGKDAPTNVLAFPAGDHTEPGPLGDVVLAYETVSDEARNAGIAFADHVSHLVIHGVLHLLGFDHMDDDEAEWMESLERTALAKLGIADPYAEQEATPCGDLTMSNAPSLQNDLPPEEARPDEEASWFERLLQTFGLGEEPDLRELIEDALARSKSDTLSTQERSMLRRILQFGTLTVEDVMVPRADIIAVDDTVSVAELMEVFRQAEHSRVPVYHETLDDPRGMVHIRDLMSWITSEAEADKEGTLNLAKVDLARSIASINILREILYVPGSMSVLDLLLKMQTTRLHLALVVDEYGGTDGLVSIEDLVEEVVGDIADEHDVEDEPLIKSDPRLGLVAAARTPIFDLEKYLAFELASEEQEEEVDTLGGLVFAIAGRIPARGELVRHASGIEFEVLDADPRRIKKLRIHLPPAAETEQAESA